MFPSLASIPIRMSSQAKLLLTFLAISVQFFKIAASTSHVEDVINDLKDLCFYIDLFSIEDEKAEGVRLIAPKLTENPRNKQ